MKKDTGFEAIGQLFAKNVQQKKPPAYEWQDLALRIIAELHIPNFKRNSIFKICKNNSKELIEKCLNETKELCKNGETWKYFFKLIENFGKNTNSTQN